MLALALPPALPNTFLTLLVALLIAGVLLWAINQLPLDETIRKIARVVVVAVTAIWVIYWLAGLFPFR